MNGFITLDFLKNDGSADLSAEIQNIINENPNRTIYFPDGTYRLDKPIYTPADPQKSVDLQLSNYAVLKAGEGWKREYGAVVHLGGICPKNDVSTNGSNYSFTGGIVDGSGIADGISIDGGRETAIRRVSIKHTKTGIIIEYGANSGSSDSDISDVNIYGTCSVDSVGVIVRGYDNTFKNMRIGGINRGFEVYSSGNVLRDIHPLYYAGYDNYEDSCGFYDHGGNNWYDYCYSDQFCNGFITDGSVSSIYDKCFCFWYSSKGGRETIFRADGQFNSLVTSMRAGFRGEGNTFNTVLAAREDGYGKFENLLGYIPNFSDDFYKKYLEGRVIG